METSQNTSQLPVKSSVLLASPVVGFKRNGIERIEQENKKKNNNLWALFN